MYANYLLPHLPSVFVCLFFVKASGLCFINLRCRMIVIIIVAPTDVSQPILRRPSAVDGTLKFKSYSAVQSNIRYNDDVSHEIF